MFCMKPGKSWPAEIVRSDCESGGEVLNDDLRFVRMVQFEEMMTGEEEGTDKGKRV